MPKDHEYAFRSGKGKHTWTAYHEDVGRLGSHSGDDEHETLHQLQKSVVKRHYMNSDDSHGSQHLIGSREAWDLHRFDTKIGTLKYVKNDA